MTPSPPTTRDNPLIIPEELRAGRRTSSAAAPSKVRPQALAHPRGRGREGDGNLAPPEAGEGARRRDPLGPRELLGARRGMRSCSATAARPPSGTRRRSARPAPRAAPDLRRVLPEVRLGHLRGAVPRGLDRDLRRPGRRPRSARRRRPRRRRRRGRDRVGAQRDLDRRDDPVVRPEPAGEALVLIDATSGAGGLPVDLPRWMPTTSPRRRASPPTAACGWRCSARPRRSGWRRSPPPSAGSRRSSR